MARTTAHTTTRGKRVRSRQRNRRAGVIVKAAVDAAAVRDARHSGMTAASLFVHDVRRFRLRTDDEPIPVPPGEEKPPVQEPPDGPTTEPDAPVRDPDPVEPQRLHANA